MSLHTSRGFFST
nr:unnamed protein product [Callosobruchus chinensis]